MISSRIKTWIDVMQYVRCFFFFTFTFLCFFSIFFFFINLSFSYNHQLGTYVCICPLFSLVKTWRELKWLHVRCTYREVRFSRDPHIKGRHDWALARNEIHKLVDTYDRLTWRAKLVPAVWGRLSTKNAETWQVDRLVDHWIDHFINFGTLGASKVRVRYVSRLGTEYRHKEAQNIHNIRNTEMSQPM